MKVLKAIRILGAVTETITEDYFGFTPIDSLAKTISQAIKRR